MNSEPTTWDDRQLSRLAEDAESIGSQPALTNDDIDFLSSCDSLRERQVDMKRRWIPLLGLAFIGAFLFWAGRAELEQVTRGEGKVIPSKKVRLIQSLESGLLEQIHVREGQLVEEGQELLRMRDAIFSAHYQGKRRPPGNTARPHGPAHRRS